MRLREEVEILQQIPLFAGVKKDQLNTLAFAAEQIEIAPGELIAKQGEAPDAAYVILSGQAEAVIDDDDVHVVTEIGVASFIGEAAILNNTPYRVSVRAKSKIRAIKISRDLFFRSVSEFPDMANAITRILARRLDDTLDDLFKIKDHIDHEDKT